MAVKLMIVDDSQFMRALLKKIVVAECTVVGEATNGIEAVKMYEELKPDIVTMDVVMPKMDGITATSHIVKRNPDAKVIMCTSVGQEEKIKKAIAAGAKGYVNKPFQGPKVLQEINSVLTA